MLQDITMVHHMYCTSICNCWHHY